MTPLKEEQKLKMSTSASSNEVNESWADAVVHHYDINDSGVSNSSFIKSSSTASTSDPSDEAALPPMPARSAPTTPTAATSSPKKSPFRQSLEQCHSREYTPVQSDYTPVRSNVDSYLSSPASRKGRAPYLELEEGELELAPEFPGNDYKDSSLNEEPSSLDGDNKSALRRSMSSTLLTATERTFLESLLRLEGEVADALCGEALRNLRLFDDGDRGGVFGVCSGEEMCLADRVPGHRWRAAGSVRGEGTAKREGIRDRFKAKGEEGVRGSLAAERESSGLVRDSGGDWVQDWVKRGNGSDESNPTTLAQALPYRLERTANLQGGGDDTDGNVAPQAPPHPQLERRPSARLERLAYKKRQSSSGNDSTVRLYRAHEAGLVITQRGSARRTLGRLGLEIDSRPPGSGGSGFGAGGDVKAASRSFFGPGQNGLGLEIETFGKRGGITPAGAVSAAVHRADENAATGITAAHRSPFHEDENSLADDRSLDAPDERAVRRIESAERSKQKHQQRALAELDILSSRTDYGGCAAASPFAGDVLKNMYASKQFSFRRSGSSYSRYDSFLNRTEEESGEESDPAGSDGIAAAGTESAAATSSSGSESVPPASREDIFRPSPTERRLRSLLASAGFATPKGMLREAEPEDVLSLDNSVGRLLLRGGPSFAEDEVFREDFEGQPEIVEVKAKDTAKSSVLSSIGSNFSPTSSQEGHHFFPIAPTSSRDEDDEADQDVADRKGAESPANSVKSDVGELPGPPLSARHSLHKRNSTISIMKSSSSCSSLKKGQYRRSVSWGHMVVKDSESGHSKRSETESVPDGGISVISFPNLRRAAPVRSDSLGSVASGIGSMGSGIPPLRLGAPLRSESMSSVASALSSGIPLLSRARPVFSPRNSLALERVPSLHRAARLRSESTLGTEANDDYSACSYGNEVDEINRGRTYSNGAAWASPFAPKRWQPPRSLSRQSSAASLTGRNILIRQASRNNYDGEGMEIDEFLDGQVNMSLGNARNFKSMVSMGGGDSVVSTRSRSSSRLAVPFQSLDDGFIVRNVDFERHSSEILRSLSNEDLYSSHNVETIGGTSSVARVYGDLMEGDSKSWDLQDENSCGPGQNAWGVFEDEYAEEYANYNSLSFQILGTSADDKSCHPHVLSPPLMESLQNFLPPGIAENNFWLKYSLVRDGASLPSLLRQVRGAQYTLIAMETVDGEVFGCFTSSPWRKTWNYYGNGEAFLWRMRRTRSDKDAQRSILDQAKLESELDVFYWTGKNDLVQLCTHNMIAVGGGAFQSFNEGRRSSGDSDEGRDLPPQNEEFAKADKGGFGLAIDAELLRGTSSPCATFNSPPLSRAHPNGSPFEIVNLEAWTLTPFYNVADAENFEMKKLFLEPYSGQ